MSQVKLLAPSESRSVLGAVRICGWMFVVISLVSMVVMQRIDPDQQLPFSWVTLLGGVSLLIAAKLGGVLDRRRADARLTLELSPNLITVDGAQFCASFSGEGSLIANPEQFADAVRQVAERETRVPILKWFYARENALVRIVPGAASFTQLQFDMVCQVMGTEFVSVEYEVVVPKRAASE